jgi:hypothetical protein
MVLEAASSRPEVVESWKMNDEFQIMILEEVVSEFNYTLRYPNDPFWVHATIGKVFVYISKSGRIRIGNGVDDLFSADLADPHSIPMAQKRLREVVKMPKRYRTTRKIS